MTPRSPFLMRSGFLAFRLLLSILGLFVMAAFFGGPAYADGVTVEGVLAGCGGVGAFDSGLLSASASATRTGGAVSGSANLPNGGLSVSETSSPGCSGFVYSTFLIEGTISLPTDLPSFVGITDTTFVESNNCAVVGCGNVGGEPLAELLFSGSLEDLVNGNTESFNCGGFIGPGSTGASIVKAAAAI